MRDFDWSAVDSEAEHLVARIGEVRQREKAVGEGVQGCGAERRSLAARCGVVRDRTQQLQRRLLALARRCRRQVWQVRRSRWPLLMVERWLRWRLQLYRRWRRGAAD